jgi:hypothetical protein
MREFTEPVWSSGPSPRLKVICDDETNCGGSWYGIMLDRIDIGSPDMNSWRGQFHYEDYLALEGSSVNTQEGVDIEGSQRETRGGGGVHHLDLSVDHTNRVADMLDSL